MTEIDDKIAEQKRQHRIEYQKQWNARNKEAQAIKKREYRLRNIEQIKARDKAYYDANRQKILEYKREHDNRVSTQKDWREVINKVQEQLDNVFTPKGIKPTLRTMHYRLYSLGIISNTRSDYGQLSRITTKAREQRESNVYGSKGKVRKEYYPRLDIDCFADDSRKATRGMSEFDIWQPEHIISNRISDLTSLEKDYEDYIPKWVDQPHYVEIWTEKKAMVGTFQEIIGNREVDIVPFGGYHSVPYLWNNASILKRYQNMGKKIHILYFGDFDPTGEDIERVIKDRLRYYGVSDIDFERIGVTKKQMIDFNLPQDVDALTEEKLKRDARAQTFISKHGKLHQIEVDALPALRPDEFRNMVINSVERYYDEDIYDKVLGEYSPEMIHDYVREQLKSEFGFKE